MKIYTYDEKKVEVNEKGIVTHSDFDFCTVGKKADTKALKACGWRLKKSPAIYYSHGDTSPYMFSK